jgi:hypothetical protein
MDELTAAIKQQKTHKSPGPDQVTNELLKILDHNNLEQILEQINTFMGQCAKRNEEVPETMTDARIISLYKKGDPEQLGNYRPIALTNALYKTLMVMIRNRIH